jgi:acetolactate synthase-1/2/3 large subunit
MANGSQALLETLVNAGVDTCFANPGTSEMHLVAAIGKTEGVRPILCLFEGAVTGAADGYARMRDKPAICLLHVGSGFSNGMANLHNAKRAHVPLVNIVGDHATYHLQYDTPLTSDVPGHAHLCSDWVKVSTSADDLAASGAAAVQAALRGAGKIATLIVPANHAWEPASRKYPRLAPEAPASVPSAEIERIAAMFTNGKRTAFVLGGRALREPALTAVGRIAGVTGAALLSETLPARLQRGAGRVCTRRIPYFVEQGIEFLEDYEQLILAGAPAPAAFFAYPGQPGLLAPQHCAIETLATVDHDITAAMDALATALNAPPAPAGFQQRVVQTPPTGSLTPAAIGQSISALLPENAIVSDEGITCGLEIFGKTQAALPHDWLAITGGALGQGLPVSFGAAVACPDRKVVALQADGAAMYTVQTLWSMARENADVTVVLCNNSSYAILNIELSRLADDVPNEKTRSMLDLGNPSIDWVSIARGMQVPATRATTAEAFHAQFSEAMETPGPRLIEALVVQDLADRISKKG